MISSDILSLLGVLVLLGAMVYSALTVKYRQFNKGKKKVKASFIANLEREVPNLTDVLVPLHVIDMPKGAFLEAVRHNMKRGVKYTFLVSPDNFEKSKETYFQFFQSIAKEITWDLSVEVEDIVRIRPLKDKWIHPPIIYYKTQEDERGIEGTLVYMGDQKGVGLARFYSLLPPATSLIFYGYLVNNVAWSENDDEIKEVFSLTYEEFVQPNDLIDDDKIRKLEAS